MPVPIFSNPVRSQNGMNERRHGQMVEVALQVVGAAHLHATLTRNLSQRRIVFDQTVAGRADRAPVHERIETLRPAGTTIDAVVRNVSRVRAPRVRVPHQAHMPVAFENLLGLLFREPSHASLPLRNKARRVGVMPPKMPSLYSMPSAPHSR
jgi:hypothetical protein